MAGSGTAHLRPGTETLLRVENLVVDFPAGRGRKVSAVANISFDVAQGETLGLVGESGCGKSTTGKAIMQLPRPTRGSVVLDGTDLTTLAGADLRKVRPRMQMIFQDPISSLNPRRTVSQIVGEPLSIWKTGDAAFRAAKVEEVLSAVGVDPVAASERKPHEFSGGQCQRIGIARSMILKPRLIVCDEPVSALDVSIQAQIVNLLMRLQREFGLSLIFISHNLAVVRHICHRIMVLYLGRLAEMAGRDDIYRSPRHPYTQALISAVPIPDPELERSRQRVVLKGDLPSPLSPPSGCVFRTRCPRATDVCAQQVPMVESVVPGHDVACHHWRAT